MPFYPTGADKFPLSSTTSIQPAVRFYTDFDPYHVTVDNRPLVDLQSCIGVTSTSADVARVIGGNTQISQIVESLFTKTNKGDYVIQGMAIYEKSPLVLNITPGILYVPVQVTQQTSYLFAGLSAANESIPLAAPSTNGLERWVLVQMQFMTQDLLPAGSLPYQDSVNSIAKEANFIGGVVYSIKVGADAAIGSAAMPTPDANHTALAWVRLEAGASTVKGFQYAPGRLNDVSGFAELAVGTANPAVQSVVNYNTVYSLSKSATTTVGYCYKPSSFIGGFVDYEISLQADTIGNIGLDVDVVITRDGGNLDSLTPTTFRTSVAITQAGEITRARLRIPVIVSRNTGWQLVGQIKRITTGDSIATPVRLISLRIEQ